MQNEERQITITDLDPKRCINCMRRLHRKGLSTSRVWVVSRQDTKGRVTRSLVMPLSYYSALTPMMQSVAVFFNGKLR
jgi:hypothetical protein